MCKFESPDDPNYNILLRCFNTTIEQIEKECKCETSRNRKLRLLIVHNLTEGQTSKTSSKPTEPR